MAERKTGLGKGLGALIPTAGSARPESGKSATEGATGSTRRPVDLLFGEPKSDAEPGGVPGASTDTAKPGLVEVPGAAFALIALDAITPNPRQPREIFDEDALRELADSIKEVGLLQPVVVRPVGSPDESRYELVMGERRWRASKLAGLSEVPAIVRETDESELLLDALLENLHRAQLNPLEEAAAYRQLLDDFSCTQEELSARIARSRPQISNTLRLLKLPPLVQRRVAAGVISAGHARALLGLEDAAAMERLAQRVVAEGLSVRTTEELVAIGEVPAEPNARGQKAQARAGGRHDALDALRERLTDLLDTKVTLTLGKKKGRLSIEFASVADLNRIIAILAPEDPGVLK
ncbi:MAG: ParB/RepB/Spo0J family partition protein [Bifidobacteriaceae bacterium]|jgi:ParB family chromosome partitioning protein|nr:ParB/RepB/Spo0J family partition protein [Bifidobacteriaceae bacterium]